MTLTNVTNQDLLELYGTGNKEQHCKVTFPLLGAHGTSQTATVYFELEPGDHLGMHRDSAEELLVVLEGEVQAEVGEESAKATTGSIILVPKMVPHNVTNNGSTVARVLGVFGGANHIETQFDNGWEPDGNSVVKTEALFQQR